MRDEVSVARVQGDMYTYVVKVFTCATMLTHL